MAGALYSAAVEICWDTKPRICFTIGSYNDWRSRLLINPLAIPVAVGGGIRLINEFFRKTKKEKKKEGEGEGEDDGLEVATMGAPNTY
jgi:hypothetical protein